MKIRHSKNESKYEEPKRKIVIPLQITGVYWHKCIVYFMTDLCSLLWAQMFNEAKTTFIISDFLYSLVSQNTKFSHLVMTFLTVSLILKWQTPSMALTASILNTEDKRKLSSDLLGGPKPMSPWNSSSFRELRPWR